MSQIQFLSSTLRKCALLQCFLTLWAAPMLAQDLGSSDALIQNDPLQTHHSHSHSHSSSHHHHKGRKGLKPVYACGRSLSNQVQHIDGGPSTNITFDFNQVTPVGVIHHPGTETFQVLESGVYEISWTINLRNPPNSGTSPLQNLEVRLFLNPLTGDPIGQVADFEISDNFSLNEVVVSGQILTTLQAFDNVILSLAVEDVTASDLNVIELRERIFTIQKIAKIPPQ